MHIGRRQWIRTLTLCGISAAVLPRQARSAGTLRFETEGAGPDLLVGHPITLAPDAAKVSRGYIDRLRDRYRVTVMENPATVVPPELNTVENVVSEILAVADAANADRFAWYGFSIGAVTGIQLALRTNRLTAFVCGGWSPLDGPYAAASAATEWSAANGGSSAGAVFYRSLLKDWSEREAIQKIRCPRMAFAGTNDTFTAVGHDVRIGPTLAERKNELERMGWTVRLVDGFGHELGQRPEDAVPVIRTFLDPLLLKA